MLSKKLSLLGITAVALAFGSSHVARAGNLAVTNGGFESFTGGSSGDPSQLGDSGTGGYSSITGWTVGSTYGFLMASGSADTTGSHSPQYGNTFTLWGSNNGGVNSIPASSPYGGNYLALDGGSRYRGTGISQTISGLTAGDQYSVSFYWAGAFPPRSPIRLLGWLLSVHTSHMFAYPGGGDHGASALTTGMVIAAIVAYLKRGSKLILALMLTPFILGLLAAAMGRYPYGGSARTMQYVAPSILLLAGLGASVFVSRFPWPIWRERLPFWAMSLLLICGVGMMAWDIVYPYKTQFFQGSRELARKFWAEESVDAEILCAWTDLRLPLKPLRWQQDREVSYLCHQAIYSPRHSAGNPVRLDRVTQEHPLRLIVFNETQSDAKVVSRWMNEKANDYKLRARRERLLDQVFRRGKWVATDRYVIYEFVPAHDQPSAAVAFKGGAAKR